MERIVLKHLSGSKANQVEEFPLNHVKELILGRDPSSTVKYDPDRDDLVGRQHAKITQDPNDPSQFIVTDLNSRNGTFVNRQRLTGTVRINPGDVVQLGPGGPEFVFEIEPRPAGATKATRVAAGRPDSAPGHARPRRPAADGAAPAFPPTTPGRPRAPAGVGKATVERIVSQNVQQAKKSQGRTFLAVGAARRRARRRRPRRRRRLLHLARRRRTRRSSPPRPRSPRSRRGSTTSEGRPRRPPRR